MLITPGQLRTIVGHVLDDLDEQGHDVDGARAELATIPNAYDDLIAFASTLDTLALRDGWPYVEPDDIGSIEQEWSPDAVRKIDVTDAGERVAAAFTARVCGCMLGKPFEIFAGLDEIRAALESTGEWPLSDYPTEAALRALPSLQGQWRELHRDGITHVAPDDDINYTILAMLVLEQHGLDFTHAHLETLWLYNLPVLVTFGPERTRLVRSALTTVTGGDVALARVLNPGAELCGAFIRADAYGYACMGRPDVAAKLAHRDASFTHRRTGVYGPMFVAATIASAPASRDPLDAIRAGLQFVPQRSRFAERARTSLELVEAADDWLDGYRAVHDRFGDFGFCRIYQELGLLINALRFGSDPADGFCKQVMQGLDTDSFGATAGSILGAVFGPGHLDDRWTAPLNDDVRTALAIFHERSLSAITDRMAALPARVADDLRTR